MAHCQRGDEYIVGQQAHTYKWEGGGAAVLGSIQPQPLDFESDGTLSLTKVAQAIKPLDDHHPRTKVLCIENTHSGKALPMAYLAEVEKFCKEKKNAKFLSGSAGWIVSKERFFNVKAINNLKMLAVILVHNLTVLMPMNQMV